MSSCLIGHTGFVGGALARRHAFDDCYNSANIGDIRGRAYDLIVCAGAYAAKWLANQRPEEDRARIDALLGPLETVESGAFVLISTVDVYPVRAGVDESYDCRAAPNHAYGANRLYLEDAVAGRANAVVLRLSGLFGPGLKKNVLYDLLNDNCLDLINPESAFQWYDVEALWDDIGAVRRSGIGLVNLVNEPIPTGDIIERYFPGKTVGANSAPKAAYDVRTRHCAELGGRDGHILGRDAVLQAIGRFVAAYPGTASPP